MEAAPFFQPSIAPEGFALYLSQHATVARGNAGLQSRSTRRRRLSTIFLASSAATKKIVGPSASSAANKKIVGPSGSSSQGKGCGCVSIIFLASSAANKKIVGPSGSSSQGKGRRRLAIIFLASSADIKKI
eukprot:6831438-Karenia_brevis.AAC.1